MKSEKTTSFLVATISLNFSTLGRGSNLAYFPVKGAQRCEEDIYLCTGSSEISTPEQHLPRELNEESYWSLSKNVFAAEITGTGQFLFFFLLPIRNKTKNHNNAAISLRV